MEDKQGEDVEGIGQSHAMPLLTVAGRRVLLPQWSSCLLLAPTGGVSSVAGWRAEGR